MTDITDTVDTTDVPSTTSAPSLAIFWLYVLIPLTWGLYNTIVKAMKLFA